jgi:polyhydroxyalkanoate synthesis regulator phasin
MSTSKSKNESGKKNVVSEIIEDVTNMVKTSVFASLGVAFLGQEMIEKWAKKVAKDNDLSTTDVKSFIKDVRQQSMEARKDIEKRVKSLLNDILPSTKKKSDKTTKSKSKKKSKKKSHSISKASVNKVEESREEL